MTFKLISLSEVVYMAHMAVDKDYVERLQAWVTAEAKKHARNPDEKGVNAYAEFTTQRLAQYGLKGIRNSMIARWIEGQLEAEVKGPTYQKIGLLKGLSDDPKEAEKLAYLWLKGEELPTYNTATAAPAVPAVAPVPSDEDAEGHPLVEKVRTEPLSPAVLRAIAVAAVDRLTAAVNSIEPEEEAEEMKPSPLTFLLEGWMKTNDEDVAGLAQALQITTARAQEIMNGAVMNETECNAVAKLANLEVGTLVGWGACSVSS
jgi:hypothetical protein